MAENTSIEWCDHTWSPWEGCTKVSPGCDHCYAEARNQRFAKGANWGPGAPRRITVDWTKPLLWNRQAAAAGRQLRVFPSLCDPFDNEVPQYLRTRFFGLIERTPHLTWLLLTKRIGNAADMLRTDPPEGVDISALPNVRIGATIVNQLEWDRDIGKLLRLNMPNFVSLEPLLGPIDMRLGGASIPDYSSHQPLPRQPEWVIVGGESGPHARPANGDWYRSLRDQCDAARVPFLFKQHGEWIDPRDLRRLPGGGMPGFGVFDGCRHDMATDAVRVGKKSAGRHLDGRTHDEFPATTSST